MNAGIGGFINVRIIIGGFINVGVNLQMTVGICKCRRGFTNASNRFRKCLHFYSSPLFLNLDTNGTP